jgi:hypothetical protein
MAELELPKLAVRVRFPSPAPPDAAGRRHDCPCPGLPSPRSIREISRVVLGSPFFSGFASTVLAVVRSVHPALMPTRSGFWSLTSLTSGPSTGSVCGHSCCKGCSPGLATSPPPIHVSAVADPHDEDQVLVVVDLVEDAVVPNTDAVLISSADF